MRLIGRFRHETSDGNVVEVAWTPDGLEVTINGVKRDTSAELFGGPGETREFKALEYAGPRK